MVKRYITIQQAKTLANLETFKPIYKDILVKANFLIKERLIDIKTSRWFK